MALVGVELMALMFGIVVSIRQLLKMIDPIKIVSSSKHPSYSHSKCLNDSLAMGSFYLIVSEVVFDDFAQEKLFCDLVYTLGSVISSNGFRGFIQSEYVFVGFHNADPL